MIENLDHNGKPIVDNFERPISKGDLVLYNSGQRGFTGFHVSMVEGFKVTPKQTKVLLKNTGLGCPPYACFSENLLVIDDGLLENIKKKIILKELKK